VGLEGLECLEMVGGQVYIGETNLLFDLTGLDGLHTVQGEFEIGSNAGLQSLAGADALSSVGWLSIYANANLGSITGLHALVSISGGVGVQDNPSLPTCDAIALIDALETAPEYICIAGNSPDGCAEMCE